MQTRTITLANLDKFSHIGIFSGGSIAPTNITDMAAFKQKVKAVSIRSLAIPRLISSVCSEN